MEDISKNLSIPLDFKPNVKWLRDHPQEQVIGNIHKGVRTRSSRKYEVMFSCFISQIETKSIDEALSDPNWTQPCKKNSISLRGIKYGNSF